MFGQLNDAEIEELLTQQLVGRIGCHANDITYVVPVSYVYDGTYIYARTYEGLKLELMRKNPEVCFQADSMHNLANWKSVVAWGNFKELTETGERNKGIKKLLARKITGVASKTMHLSAHWPFSAEENDYKTEGIIFCIHLNKKTGRFEKSDEPAHINN